MVYFPFNPKLERRNPVRLLLCTSRSGYSPRFMKRGGLESSGRRLLSSIGKTKRIASFFFGKKIFLKQLEIRNSVLLLLSMSRSGFPPRILKRGGPESSGQRLISSFGKTKGNSIFFFRQKKIYLKFPDFSKKVIFKIFWDFLRFFIFFNILKNFKFFGFFLWIFLKFSLRFFLDF